MRLPRFGVYIVAAALASTGIVAVIWHFWPHVYDAIRDAEQLIVYEGLPHPMYEERLFHEELKTKQTIQLSGFPFYREPLKLKNEDLTALRHVLGDGGTYRSYTGEKKCGGFHPDYAVEWTSKGEVYHCLICFGCSEARFDDPGRKNIFYDLRYEGNLRNQATGLLKLLRPYRKNRPAHERFGIGPLASALVRSLRWGLASMYRGEAPPYMAQPASSLPRACLVQVLATWDNYLVPIRSP